MTSDEIRAIIEPIRQWDNHGEATRQLLAIYEIAYQLAVMNERNDVPKLKHNPFGESLGSPVGADSDKPLRGDYHHKLHVILANTLRPIMSQATADAGFADWLASAIEQEFIIIDRDADERTTRPNPQAASLQKP